MTDIGYEIASNYTCDYLEDPGNRSACEAANRHYNGVVITTLVFMLLYG